jgi:hypothetical protein
VAEGDAVTSAPKNAFGFLGQKAGPLPIGVWLVAAIAIWWYLNRKNAGASGAASGTDQAVDPVTGQPYSQELGAAEQQLSDQASSNQSTTAGQFTDNNTWAQAAINYLVARGVDPAQATDAIETFLSGQSLTTQQQGDVNLAIQGLGAPPDVPGPASPPAGTVIPPPSSGGTPTPTPTSTGTVTRYPAPSGLKVTSKTNTTVTVQWNQTNPAAKSFTVATYQLNGKRVGYSTVDVPDAKGGHGVFTVTGLHSKYSYKINVWANGGKQAPSHATVAVTLK